jgi:hypothetical protein
VEKLLRSVLVQALKDFAKSDANVDPILEWTRSQMFGDICSWIELDQDKVIEVFGDLARYEQPVRTAMIKEIISSVRESR